MPRKRRRTGPPAPPTRPGPSPLAAQCFRGRLVVEDALDGACSPTAGEPPHSTAAIRPIRRHDIGPWLTGADVRRIMAVAGPQTLTPAGPLPAPSGTPAESDGAADYVATQHALVAAVCAALAPLLADVQEGVRAVLGGDGPEQERCDVVDFHIEGEPSEFRIMARYGDSYDEVMTVCYDMPADLSNRLRQHGLDEVVLAGYTCIDWFHRHVWPAAPEHTRHCRTATVRVAGDRRVWDLLQGGWQPSTAGPPPDSA